MKPITFGIEDLTYMWDSMMHNFYHETQKDGVKQKDRFALIRCAGPEMEERFEDVTVPAGGYMMWFDSPLSAITAYKVASQHGHTTLTFVDGEGYCVITNAEVWLDG